VRLERQSTSKCCWAIDITVTDRLSFIVNLRTGGEQMQAYCVKCRAKKEMKDPKAITMKNGKPATQGICPSCGTKMFRIGKA
jgi:Zn finger protein HypA/HybF involved in hydrogenase expression